MNTEKGTQVCHGEGVWGAVLTFPAGARKPRGVRRHSLRIGGEEGRREALYRAHPERMVNAKGKQKDFHVVEKENNVQYLGKCDEFLYY